RICLNECERRTCIYITVSEIMLHSLFWEDMMDGDVIVVGGGLAGLVAAHELTRAGRRVLLVDQENASNLGGQAFWSFGGLFLVSSPVRRRLGVYDTFGHGWRDWRGSAGWDRLAGPLPEDVWAMRWGRAYVQFAAGEKRDWLR